MSTVPPLRYVSLGDSTAVGVGAQRGGYPERLVRRVAEHGVALELVNVAAAGATVTDVAERQLAPALAASPLVSTLGIGINDVMDGTDVDRFARCYEDVATALAAAPLLLLNVPDVSRLPYVADAGLRRATRERAVAINARIAALAARLDLVVVDLFEWTAAAEHDRDLLSDDGFHPSDQGYERWAEAMEGAFLAMVRRAAPAFTPRGP